MSWQHVRIRCGDSRCALTWVHPNTLHGNICSSCCLRPGCPLCGLWADEDDPDDEPLPMAVIDDATSLETTLQALDPHWLDRVSLPPPTILPALPEPLAPRLDGAGPVDVTRYDRLVAQFAHRAESERVAQLLHVLHSFEGRRLPSLLQLDSFLLQPITAREHQVVKVHPNMPVVPAPELVAAFRRIRAGLPTVRQVLAQLEDHVLPPRRYFDELRTSRVQRLDVWRRFVATQEDTSRVIRV